MQKLKTKLPKNFRFFASNNQNLNDLKDLDTKKHYQFVLYKAMTKKDFKANKDECLSYLGSLFNAYQNFISQNNIRNKKLINYWQLYLSKNDREVILSVIKVLNKHGNFKELKNYIKNNIHAYNPKEIAFISKTFNSISLSDNDLSEIISGHCCNNIEKLDLYDIENITFNNCNKPFMQFSLKYVIKKLVEKKSENIKLNIDVNDDKFENQMLEIDNEFNQQWLKLKILQNYKSCMNKCSFEDVVNLYFDDMRKLKNINQPFYEINCVVNLWSLSTKLRETKNIRLDKSVLIYFLENDYLNKLFKNLDYYEYKSDLFDYFDGLLFRKKLDFEQLDYLYNYFRIQITNVKSGFLFFDYCRILSVIIKFMSQNVHYRQKAYLVKPNDDRLLNDEFYANHFINNLDNKIKLVLQVKFDILINKFHGMNFKSIVESLKFLIQIHKTPVDALNSFYTNFFQFYSTIASNDLHLFRQKILNLLGTLIELKNDHSASNELKLCLLLDTKFYYIKKFSTSAKKNFIIFLMLNEESCLKNFQLIAKNLRFLIPHLDINYHGLGNISNLIYSYFDLLLLGEHKQDLFKVLTVLFKHYSSELLANNVKMNEQQKKLDDTISRIMKDIHAPKYSNIITIEDKKNLFLDFDKFDLGLDELKPQIGVFNDNSAYMKIDQKLSLLVEILKNGNYYSEKILDQLWNFLIKTFSLLEKSSNSKDIVQKSINLVHIMSLYSHFDYTSCEMYFKKYRLFENLNNEIYEKILRDNIINAGILVVYVESLISLNLFVESAFYDMIKDAVS